MPSVKTHDVVTLVSGPVAAAAGWLLTRDLASTAILTTTALFGGYMFGPDLDVVSRPYKRWGPLRVIWYPYQRVMPHRSRYSHGLVFGTLIRVLYFSVVVALMYSAGMMLWFVYLHDIPASPSMAVDGFQSVFGALLSVDGRYLFAGFAGLWFGGAVHTLTDILGSLLKALWQAL